MSRRKTAFPPTPAQAPAKRPSHLLWIIPPLFLAVLAGTIYLLVMQGRDPSDGIALGLADPTPPKMVRVPGGTFTMGRDDGPEDERPAHAVTVKPFDMDETEVTNAQFAAFVTATGYKTVAERQPDWEELKKQLPPGTPKPPDGELVPGSAVFHRAGVSTDPRTWSNPGLPPWWRYVPGACWRRPEGKGTNLKDKA